MTDSVLMNFYIPRHLKSRLEDVCDHRHLSRTSFILTTLEPVIEHWEQKIRSGRQPTDRHQQLPENDLPSFYSSHEVADDW